MQQRDKTNHGATNIDGELDNICPDNGCHAAFKCVNERERHYNGDGSNAARPKSDADYNGDGPHAHAFSSGPRGQKDSGGDAVQLLAKAPVNELVGGKHLAAKILWDKD